MERKDRTVGQWRRPFSANCGLEWKPFNAISAPDYSLVAVLKGEYPILRVEKILRGRLHLCKHPGLLSE